MTTQYDLNLHIDIAFLDLLCFIICIPIETVNELIVYSPCNHYFSRDAVVESCRTAIDQGMTTSVHRCPICITEMGGKPDMEDQMGTIPYYMLEGMLSPEQMGRLGRQLIRIESQKVEDELRKNNFGAVADGAMGEYLKNCN